MNLIPLGEIASSAEAAKTLCVPNLANSYDLISKSVKINFINDRVTYSAPVNFTEASLSPRHRWFPYKEGFSPKFVKQFLEQYLGNVSDEAAVLDPFCGVGTTAIEAARVGYEGVGIDVSPLAVFIAETKALNITKTQSQSIKKDLELFLRSGLTDRADAPDNATVCSYFQSEYLDALLRIKAFALRLENIWSRSLFMLAFLTSVETFSTHRKAGNGLKRKTVFKYRDQLLSPIEQVKAAIQNQLTVYIRDIEADPLRARASFQMENSLEADLGTNRFSCVLTSPPYANCFDYSKIYLCELWLGDFFSSSASQRLFRQRSVRSHVHARWPSRFSEMGSQTIDKIVVPYLSSKKLWSSSIPQMLSGYFADLGKLFSNLYHTMRSEGVLGFVVSNSAYAGVPIATDLLLCEVAQRHGYIPEEIVIYRKIVPSSQQFIELGDLLYMRESLVIIRRP